MHISMHNHTSTHSFFVNLPTNLSPGPSLEVGVDVSSNARTHEVQVEIPAKQQAFAATLISAFRNLNQLVVHASEESSNSCSDILTIKMPDAVEFKIKFSAHEVNVAAASALIDDDGVLIIRVQRVRDWLYRHSLSSV